MTRDEDVAEKLVLDWLHGGREYPWIVLRDRIAVALREARAEGMRDIAEIVQAWAEAGNIESYVQLSERIDAKMEAGESCEAK